MSLNQCQFIGNLGADPEMRTFQSGDKVCNLRLAVSDTWKDRNTGEKRERTEWVSVAVFGPLAGICEQYLRKGSKVFISGQFRTRKWQDQSGADRYSTEIVLQGPQAVMQMLDSPNGGGNQRQPDSRYGGQSGDYGGDYGSSQQSSRSQRELDDEIPF